MGLEVVAKVRTAAVLAAMLCATIIGSTFVSVALAQVTHTASREQTVTNLSGGVNFPDLLTVNADWLLELGPITCDGEHSDYFIRVSGPPADEEGPRASISLVARAADYGQGYRTGVFVSCPNCVSNWVPLSHSYSGGDPVQLNYDNDNKRWGVFAQGQSMLITSDESDLAEADTVEIGGEVIGVRSALGDFVHENIALFRNVSNAWGVFNPSDSREQVKHSTRGLLRFLTRYYSTSGTLHVFTTSSSPPTCP